LKRPGSECFGDVHEIDECEGQVMAEVNIVVLTGAGISHESGLPTFRDRDGLWSAKRLRDLASPEAFLRDPAAVHDFYNARRAQANSPEVQPNPAHRALAKLEQEWAGHFVVVTQNVDDLHERAGSSNVLHMHGRLNRVRCNACSAIHTWRNDVFVDTACPTCGNTRLRPDIVWFGEMPFYLDEIGAALGRCDLFISIGTSGSVYPAADFVNSVQRLTRTVELNLEPSAGASWFMERHYGLASQIVPEFVDKLLARPG
jgi:NAD-dependent deacetylase